MTILTPSLRIQYTSTSSSYPLIWSGYKLSLIRTAKNVESADEKLENYINFLTQEVEDFYNKKGLRRYIRPIEIAAHGSLAMIHDWGVMNFVPPEISFFIENGHTVLFIAGLMDYFVLEPRQNKRFTVIEKYLKETKLVD